MLKLTVLLVIVCILFDWQVSGHRYGADPMACDSMKPGHGTAVRRTTATPYIIDTNLDGYVPCSQVGQRDCGVIVRIRPRRLRFATPFKGFLLQARSRSPDGQIAYVGEYRYMNGQQVTARNNANQINQMRMSGQFGPQAMGQRAPMVKRQVPGQFNPQLNNRFGNQLGQMGQVISNVIVQRMQCVRGTGVTHTENSPKNGVQLLWTPPVGFNRPVQFVATVVRDYSTFWMGHRSRVLRSRPRLRVQIANTARWFNSATRASSGGVVVLITTLCTLFYMTYLR